MEEGKTRFDPWFNAQPEDAEVIVARIYARVLGLRFEGDSTTELAIKQAMALTFAEGCMFGAASAAPKLSEEP